jgi:hypothetical protein
MKTTLALILTILIIIAVQKIPVPQFYTEEFMRELGTKIARKVKESKGIKCVFWFLVGLIVPACLGVAFILIFKNINQIINNL